MLKKTQVQLLDEVSKLHPKQIINKQIWNRDLQKYEKEAINEKLSKNGLPEDLMKKCKTLAQLRKNIKNYHHMELEEPRAFNLKITINKNKVTIGKKSFPVFRKKSKGKEYSCINVTYRNKKHSIRVDSLAMALHQGESD